MRKMRNLAPHAAIVIANMYYVFWGIDRVNQAMNFIDNGYTKSLLLILCLLNALCLPRLHHLDTRRRSDGRELPKLIGVALNALLCAVYIVLLLIDVVRGDASMLMLSEFVKALMLIMCALTTVNSVRLIAADRAAIRAAQARRMAARYRLMPPRRRPAAIGDPRDPRSGYARSGGRPAERSHVRDSRYNGEYVRGPRASAGNGYVRQNGYDGGYADNAYGQSRAGASRPRTRFEGED